MLRLKSNKNKQVHLPAVVVAMVVRTGVVRARTVMPVVAVIARAQSHRHNGRYNSAQEKFVLHNSRYFIMVNIGLLRI